MEAIEIDGRKNTQSHRFIPSLLTQFYWRKISATKEHLISIIPRIEIGLAREPARKKTGFPPETYNIILRVCSPKYRDRKWHEDP